MHYAGKTFSVANLQPALPSSWTEKYKHVSKKTRGDCSKFETTHQLEVRLLRN